VIRVQFEIEQDEDADMFVASWDDPAGGGITTQARSLPELYSSDLQSPISDLCPPSSFGSP